METLYHLRIHKDMLPFCVACPSKLYIVSQNYGPENQAFPHKIHHLKWSLEAAPMGLKWVDEILFSFSCRSMKTDTKTLRCLDCPLGKVLENNFLVVIRSIGAHKITFRWRNRAEGLALKVGTEVFFGWKLAGFAFLLEEGGKIGGLGGVVTTQENLNSMCFSKEWNRLWCKQTCYVFHTQGPKVTMQSSNQKNVPSTSFWEADQTSHFSENVRSPREKPPVGCFFAHPDLLKIRLRHKCPKSYFSWSRALAFIGHTWWLVLGEVPGALPWDFALASHFYWRNWRNFLHRVLPLPLAVWVLRSNPPDQHEWIRGLLLVHKKKNIKKNGASGGSKICRGEMRAGDHLQKGYDPSSYGSSRLSNLLCRPLETNDSMDAWKCPSLRWKWLVLISCGKINALSILFPC